MTAERIINALAVKHSKDVFVSECKTGPTQMARTCPRLDAWAMRKSWANPLVSGYEIKVSRSDFLGDNKWQAYLPYCNAFYFVCPKGVIDPGEVAEGPAGLMYISSTGGRLYTKRKAPYREVEIPEDIYWYILMARVQVTREFAADVDRGAYWRDWLERKEANAKLGEQVAFTMRESLGKFAHEQKQENERLARELGRLESLRAALEQMGVNPKAYNAEWELRQRAEGWGSKVPKRVVDRIGRLVDDLSRLKRELAG